MADEQTLTPEAQAQAALDARAGQSVPPVPISAPVVGSNPIGQTLGSAALASAPQWQGPIAHLDTKGGMFSPDPALNPGYIPPVFNQPLSPMGPEKPSDDVLAASQMPKTPIQPLPPPNQELVNQKADIVSGPKTAAQTSVALNSPSPVSLNKRQEELMKSEAENQAPVAQAHYDLADELNRTRTVADEVTKQKNQMLTDHAETMAGILANQQMHADMARSSADAVAKDIRDQMKAIPDVIGNPGAFTKRANIEAGDTGGQIGLKILGAIGQAAAMAGGAYGAGITHSRNFAMDIINEQIAKNVDAQKANIEKKWQQVNITHQLGNDEQLKYAHILEQDNRNELAERYKVQDYLSYLTEKTGNQDAKTRLAGLAADNAAKIADVQNNMAMQRKNFLDANVNQQVAQAAHAQSIAREEAHRLEDRHDKYVEHAMSKAGGEMSPDEAEARWTAQITGNPYVKDPNAPPSGDPELKTFNSAGQPVFAVNKEALAAKTKLDIPYQETVAAYKDLMDHKNDPIQYNAAAETLKRSLQHLEGYTRAQNDNNGFFGHLFNQSKGLDAEVPKVWSLEGDKTLQGLDNHIRAIGKAMDVSISGPPRKPRKAE